MIQVSHFGKWYTQTIIFFIWNLLFYLKEPPPLFPLETSRILPMNLIQMQKQKQPPPHTKKNPRGLKLVLLKRGQQNASALKF